MRELFGSTIYRSLRRAFMMGFIWEHIGVMLCLEVKELMDKNTLNGLSYISILFAPIIFPIIVWIVSKDKIVEYHAKRALLLHLVPGISGFVMVSGLTSVGLLYNNQTSFSGLVLGTIAIFLIINLVITILAIVLGIKQFLAKDSVSNFN